MIELAETTVLTIVGMLVKLKVRLEREFYEIPYGDGRFMQISKIGAVEGMRCYLKEEITKQNEPTQVYPTGNPHNTL